MDESAQEVLDFWFAGDHAARGARWYGGGAALDEEIRQRFSERIESASRGALDAWRSTARGTLALIIVLDQFRRNAFRGTANAFAEDPRARALCERMCGADRDRELSFLERFVVYHPLIHAEDRAAQRQGVEAFRALLKEATDAGAPEKDVALFRSGLEFAEKHAAIVERFGRFPHRNAALARTSTPEEERFLAEPGSGF
jgi:uncharacterized protein (DUF924 family)